MADATDRQLLEAVIRSLATASKSLRLYPATSPIPRQSVDAALTAIEGFFTHGAPVLALMIAREGFSAGSETIGTNIVGAADLADELRHHGVAELAITPGVRGEELLAFLSASSGAPEVVRAQGGLAMLVAAGGAENIHLTDVQLTVVEQLQPGEDQDVEAFLRELATDPDKLTAWLAAASAGDPAALQEGLLELMRVTGQSGSDALAASLSTAFMRQDPDGKDALMGLAFDPGGVRHLAGKMFGLLGAGDIAGSVLGGTFGKNMLSLSSALTHLPLEQVTAAVRAEVQAMLPGAGHSAKESTFLDHMLEVRARVEPEPSLVDADRTYRAVLQAATVSDEDVARARGAVSSSGRALSAAGVRTMLTLLDQQHDFELYCAGIDNLAGLVPQLVEQGDLALASQVLAELTRRESFNTGPWPELSGRLRDALARALGPRTAAALVRTTAADRSLVPVAREILRHAGDAAGPALVAEAVSHKAEGIEIAEELLGRRVIDLLNTVAGGAQWFQLAPVVSRLAREGDPRSVATIETLARRSDEQSRREVATGLATVGGPVATRLLGALLRDPSHEVAIIAARAIARSGVPGSAALISARLGELDIDNADFLLGRELIAILARVPEHAAEETLTRLAARKMLIKRGHFGEVQDIVRQALELRAKGGAR